MVGKAFLGITCDNAPRLGLALAVGAVGGAVFHSLSLPLAWMLGAMVAVTIAALGGLRLTIPAQFRGVFASALGVLLGSAFSPELVHRIPELGGFIAIQFVFMVLVTALAYVMHRRLGGYDRVTSYFSSTPGGLSEMTLVSEAMGGDPRIVPLNHAVRILLIVSIIPFYFRYIQGLSVPSAPTLPAAGRPMEWLDVTILLGCAIAGNQIAGRLRVPAAALMGPMFLSAAAHIAGFTASTVPSVLISIAQVVVGTSVGCRFADRMPFMVMARVIIHGTITGAAMLAFAVAFSLAAAALFDLDRRVLFLALAPGGLAEMSLIAFALGIDAAFITIMHFLRVTTVMSLGGFGFRLLPKDPRPEPAAAD